MTPEESLLVVKRVAEENHLATNSSEDLNRLPTQVGEGCVAMINIGALTMIACVPAVAARLVGIDSIPVSKLELQVVMDALGSRRFNSNQLLGGFQLIAPTGDPIIILSPWAFMHDA